jgi:hypothetical protein
MVAHVIAALVLAVAMLLTGGTWWQLVSPPLVIAPTLPLSFQVPISPVTGEVLFDSNPDGRLRR